MLEYGINESNLECGEIHARLRIVLGIEECIGQASCVRLNDDRIVLNSLDFGLPFDNLQCADNVCELVRNGGLTLESLKRHQDEVRIYTAHIDGYIEKYCVSSTYQNTVPVPRNTLHFDGTELHVIE